MEYASEGLKQSYRARSAFFRLFLKWSFFIQKFSEKNQTLIIISMVIGFRLVRTVAAAVHPLLLILVIVVYYLFVFGSWLSNGIANFLLLKDPVARISLDRSEKTEGVVIGTMFFGGIFALIAGYFIPMLPLMSVGITLLATAIPA